MNCQNLRKRQNTHHPQFYTRDVDPQFCGVVRGFHGLIFCLLSRKICEYFFSCLPGDLAVKNGGMLGEFYLVSVSLETKH